MPLSSYRIVRRADDDAEAAAELLRQVGDAGRRQRTDQADVDAGRHESRLERCFEHVARQPRVLADQHRAAFGCQHARRGACQPQRELRRSSDAGRRARGRRRCRNTSVPSSDSCHAALPTSSVAILTASTRLRHIVRADDRRAAMRPRARRARRCPASRSPAGASRDHTDQRLAGNADQHRQTDPRRGSAGPRAARGCVRALAEADARIDADARRVDAGGHARGRARAEESLHLAHDVVVLRARLHRGGLALHVHQAHGRGARSRRASSAPGACNARTSLMMCAPAATAAAHDLRLAGIDGHERPATSPRCARSPAPRGRFPPSMLTGAAPGRVDSPPTSTMAAPSSAMRSPRSNGRFEREIAPTVGERIGRDVQDAHDRRACRGRGSRSRQVSFIG